MQYTINKVKQEVFKNVYAVYDIFKNHFGEEFVDLQNLPTDEDILNTFECWDIKETEYEGVYEGEDDCWRGVMGNWATLQPYIIVWWPRVTIVNENDKSVDIQDLFAKIKLTKDGYIPFESHGFYLTRSTFPLDQWMSDYAHSHLPGVNRNHLDHFGAPCLGRGPINGTITTLKTSNDEIDWMLFCQELSVYVTVESLAGVPYRHLEEIGIVKPLSDYTGFNDNYYTPTSKLFKEIFGKDTLKEFIIWYLNKGHLTFCFKGNKFFIGQSYYEYMIDISNSFIEYFNTYLSTHYNYVEILFKNEILQRCVVVDRKFCKIGTSSEMSDVSRYKGQFVCMFKGHEVKCNIIEASNTIPQQTIIMHQSLAMFILKRILKIINYHYHNEYNNSGSTTAEDSTTSNKRCFYI